MSIFSRTRDIVAANFADLLDKAEDPAKMIRMIILEMEETLVEVRAGAARTIADQKEMRRQVARLEKLQEGWVEKAELALSKGRDDLAKAALVEIQSDEYGGGRPQRMHAELFAKTMRGLGLDSATTRQIVEKVFADMPVHTDEQRMMEARKRMLLA